MIEKQAAARDPTMFGEDVRMFGAGTMLQTQSTHTRRKRTWQKYPDFPVFVDGFVEFTFIEDCDMPNPFWD